MWGVLPGLCASHTFPTLSPAVGESCVVPCGRSDSEKCPHSRVSLRLTTTDSGTTFPKALGLFVSHTRTRCTRHVCKQVSKTVAELLSQLRTLNFAVCCSTCEVFVRAVFRLFLKVALRDTRETKRKVVQQVFESVLRCEKCALKHGGRQFEEFLWLGVVTSCCWLVVSKVVFPLKLNLISRRDF